MRIDIISNTIADDETYLKLELCQNGIHFSDRIGNSFKLNTDTVFKSDGQFFLATSDAQTFIGGSGVDTVSYAQSTLSASVDMLDVAKNSGDAEGDTFVAIDNLIGTSYRDNLRANTLDNTLHGGHGDDFILARSGNDIMYGEGGDDHLEGGNGNDSLFGGIGDDVLIGGRGADDFWGGDGKDLVSYRDAGEAVSADLSNPARNKGDAAGDTYASIEHLEGSNFDDDLRASGSDDVVFGGDGNDFVLARSGDDLIRGNAGNDRLEGGAGSDTLYGDHGADILTGNAGEDTFVYEAMGGADTITDFTKGLDGILFDGLGSSADILSLANEVGGNVVFDFGSGDTLTLVNASLSDLEDAIDVSPADDVVPIELVAVTSEAFSNNLDAPLVLTFNQDIKLADGNVQLSIYGPDGYAHVETIPAENLAVVNSQLHISPASGFKAVRDYTISFDNGLVESKSGAAFAGTDAVFSTGIGVRLPSLDFDQYDRVIDGQNFNSTLSLDAGDSNTLIINCTFENIDGSAITVRNAENITIANSSFEDIDEFGILLRSSGSTENVAIIGNTFEEIGHDGVHAAKRFDRGVDHTDLVIFDNDLHNIGTNGFYYHGIYVQSSEAVVWRNDLSGTVGANGISIRSDGLVYENTVNVTSGREYGSGIKYFSDHMTGQTKSLIIADNVVEANNLYSGIQLDETSSNQPSNIADEDWVVNDFFLLRNDVGGRYDYRIDPALEDAAWASIEFIEDAATQRAELPPASDCTMPELDETGFYSCDSDWAFLI